MVVAKDVAKMNWKLLCKSAFRALKWYVIGWFLLALISIIGLLAMIQNELNPWIFRPMVILLYITTWVGFYKFGNKKDKKNEN